ncbi:MAG: heavy metal translocating P-type ATPase [Thiohalocapsa sp. PB-PSB1]|jgi:heavy metal translocating P-type ATPase|nr:MAG: hypothetical protein N838_25480 [Thiohalocapsa sp. PB-PSB1]QQO54102.1 MAG: heavy metal translocating P-type ATPase [Thiohalocapsa sp. PB-PSB1]
MTTPEESQAATQQRVAAGAAAIIGVGTLGPHMLLFAGLPLLFINYLFMMRKIWRSFQNKSNRAVAALDALSLSLAILMGYFLTAALLFTAYFTASRLVARTEREAHIDFTRIFGELGDSVWILRDGVEVEIPLDRLEAGETIVVHAGEMIPVDGLVLAGEGLVDQHLLTGESQPAEKGVDEPVLTSTLLISGRLEILVERQGEETLTGRIAQTLEHAATFKHKVQSRGERLVEKGAIVTIAVSAVALPVLGLSKAVALSYSGFGYQMRMAAPLMVLNYLRIASRSGILVKDGRALDLLSRIDTVVFDKTGTLTEEVPTVGRIAAAEGYEEDDVLRLAASAEQRQTHPIARAICHQAEVRELTLFEAVETDYAVGHGLCVTLLDPSTRARRTILIGSRRFIDGKGIALPDAIDRLQVIAGEKGFSMVYVADDGGALVGALELCPTLRPEARDTIAALEDLGIETSILSGDQERPTRHLAESLGIDSYFAETLPDGKAQRIRALQHQGRRVCFVGDGINDSVALQQADVAVSLHGAATIAQDTAAILLLTPNLAHLPRLMRMGRQLARQMDLSENMNNVFGFACVCGVLFLGMGPSGAIVLYSGGLLSSLANSMSPLLTERRAITGPGTTS